MSRKATPIAITRHKLPPKPVAAPKPFVSKIEIPKFMPKQTEEPIAASPIPGAAPAGSRKMVNTFAKPIKLSGKTRGVRAQDIPFQLAERGGKILVAPNGSV